MPGRIIGVSIDSRGKPALRMAMQTREQHIRRDKATSNICTAQALLANMAAFYGVYHGPTGLKNIATRIHNMTAITADALKKSGYDVTEKNYFDTIIVDVSKKGKTSKEIQTAAAKEGVNIRVIDDHKVGISFGETITRTDTENLLKAFQIDKILLSNTISPHSAVIDAPLIRTSSFMTHPVFNTFHSETKMLRYLKHLESKDLSLNFSMISLGM